MLRWPRWRDGRGLAGGCRIGTPASPVLPPDCSRGVCAEDPYPARSPVGRRDAGPNRVPTASGRAIRLVWSAPGPRSPAAGRSDRIFRAFLADTVQGVSGPRRQHRTCREPRALRAERDSAVPSVVATLRGDDSRTRVVPTARDAGGASVLQGGASGGASPLERRAFQLPGIRLLGRRFERRAFQSTRVPPLPRPA